MDTPLPLFKDNTDSNTDNEELKGLDTNTNRNEELSTQELAVMVNRVLIESLEKADKKKRSTMKHSIKEIENMKNTYNAASAFTTITNNMFDKSIGYEDFEEMNQDILHQINLKNEETETNPTLHKEHKPSESRNSEDEAPPPNKKEIQVFYHRYTKLMKKTVKMKVKKLNKLMIVTRKKMMMIKKKTTKISKLDIKFSNPNLTSFQQLYTKKIFHSIINYSK
jgi:hypothetical protein